MGTLIGEEEKGCLAAERVQEFSFGATFSRLLEFSLGSLQSYSILAEFPSGSIY